MRAPKPAMAFAHDTQIRASEADDPEQLKRFIDTARERGADETEEGARKAFKKVISSKRSKGSRE
jgi:hypothetical protein